MHNLKILKNLDVKNKVVLVRVDLNVPMHNGRVIDDTRIRKIIPTLEYLIKNKAKIVLLSHFGRPKGQFVREYSLAPIADALSIAMNNKAIKFATDCIGEKIRKQISELECGDILLAENLRFHIGETKNDPQFVEELAKLGEVYVNDTFSCSHRAHASIVGLAQILPSAAGLLLQSEMEAVAKYLSKPSFPMMAIVGGSKVSTKLDLLYSLINKVQVLVVGGAMANTFLKAQGYKIGKSLYEEELVDKAKEIIKLAKEKECEIILPSDVVLAKELKEHVQNKITSVSNIANDEMILDVGPNTVDYIHEKLNAINTLVWNGPMGAFEIYPFDIGTVSIARIVAYLTIQEKIISVAGGGDVVAALTKAGLVDSISYTSTGGGAFLEWLEGKTLPGIEILLN